MLRGLRGPRLGRNRAVPLVGRIRHGVFDRFASASLTIFLSANNSSQSRFTDSSSESDVIDKHDTKSNKHHTNLMPLAVLPSAIARSTNTIQLMPFGSVELEAIDGMLLDIWRHRDHQTGKRRGKMSLRCRLPHPDGAWSGAPPHLPIGGAFHCRHARPGRDRSRGGPGLRSHGFRWQEKPAQKET